MTQFDKLGTMHIYCSLQQMVVLDQPVHETTFSIQLCLELQYDTNSDSRREHEASMQQKQILRNNFGNNPSHDKFVFDKISVLFRNIQTKRCTVQVNGRISVQVSSQNYYY